MRDDPQHESSIAKNYLKSSSIEKNCLRSSSTWTSGVHRDKESLPNSKVQKPDWYTSDRSSRRDCRVSTNWSLKESATKQAPLIIHRKCGSRCTVQLRTHICELCLPTGRSHTEADRGQSGHQAHIYEMCLSAKRGMDMDTGKEVFFALSLKV